MQLNQVLGALERPDQPSGQTQFHQALASKIRASLGHNPEALELCLEQLRALVLSDRVGFYLNIQAEWQNNTLLLQGETERLEFKSIVREVFRQLGFASISDEVQIVPDSSTHPGPFAITTAPHALTWSKPSLDGNPMDEALYGEPVYILKELSDAYLIKTLTGYWGYADKAHFRRAEHAEFIHQLNQPRVTLLQDYNTADKPIPAGSRLLLALDTTPDRVQGIDAFGNSIDLPESICQPPVCPPARMQDAIRFARSFLHAPYQLGGKNRSTGIDCSALVQLTFRVLGIHLPRDAKQQYLGGHLILPCVREALLPGDALFFMNPSGLVDHVALYLGNQTLLHATGTSVRLNSTNPEDPDYLHRLTHDFIGAKRFWS